MTATMTISARGSLLTILLGLAVASSAACADAPNAKKSSSSEKKSEKKNKKKTSSSDERDNEGAEDDEEPIRTRAERGEDDTSPASPGAPVSCIEDEECNAPGRVCEKGECIKGCRTDASCAAEERCNVTTNLCESKPTSPSPTPTPAPTPPPSPSAAECIADVECDLGKICVATRCVAGCRSTNDCKLTDVCQAGQCVPDTTPPEEPPPTETAECASDGACNPGNNGSGKICVGGRCVPGCRQDNQCPGIQICSGGQCR